MKKLVAFHSVEIDSKDAIAGKNQHIFIRASQNENIFGITFGESS
ncbi:hypothetical protein [Okeania sp. KiyG1]|nr:hypothetical protein [Okeania sp. KiyG1]